MKRMLFEHIVAQIENTPIQHEPFDHVEFEQFFPPLLYGQLLSTLPDPRDYHPLGPRDRRADGTSTRDFFDLLAPGQCEIAGIGSTHPWAKVATVLQSEHFARFMLNLFWYSVASRFGIGRSHVREMTLGPTEVRLMRDTVDYKLLPHTDSSSKLITLQVYLPKDQELIDMGTTFYEKVPNGLEWRFKSIKTLNFLPNRAYSFPIVTTGQFASWHGREKIVNNVVRDTLIVNIKRP